MIFAQDIQGQFQISACQGYLTWRANNAFNMPLKPGGYRPKSGLLFAPLLTAEKCEGKTVLDIGTGPGTLAYLAALAGAREVDAVEVDSTYVDWVGSQLRAMGMDHVISVRQSDCYSALGSDERYDLILSNPPQMPMSGEGAVHDTGGRDGMDTIRRILEGANLHLNPNGSLQMLVFDFLGIEDRTNPDLPSLREIAEASGLSQCRILQTVGVPVRPGGETAKNLSHVRKIYPDYAFQVGDEAQLINEVSIVEFAP